MINLDNLPCYYLAFNNKSIITDCNDTLADTLLYTKTELIGSKLELIFPVATKVFYQTHFAPLIALQGHASEIFISFKGRENNRVSVLCNAKTILQDNQPITVVVSIGIENRKKFENELIEARVLAETALKENTALKNAQDELKKNLNILNGSLAVLGKQNEELKQFSHVVTHELQEPLRKITLFSDLLNSEEGNLSRGDLLQKLMKATRRMRSVIGGLQNYFSLTNSPLEYERINLNAMISMVSEELNSLYPEARLILKADPIYDIYANPVQIKMLFYLLFDNCMQFRRNEEDVVIGITAAYVQQNKFQHIPNKYHYEKYLRIRIMDKGIGFRQEYSERIFNLFKKLNNSGKDGLGLAFCKKIIENHGGKISADSEPEKGTVITLLFPVEKLAVE